MNTNTPNSPQPTPTNELLELAVIDAYGLLDDEDRAAFDAGFRAAPATLRELIRSEQARIAASGELLPDIEPPAALRGRVLTSIRNECERTRAAAAPVLGRALTHGAETRPPRLRRARRVNPGWRISAVAFAVAAVVLGVLHIQLKQEFDAVREGSQLATLLDTVGVEHIEATLFDSSWHRAEFTAVDATGKEQATLWHKPDSDEARLYIMNFANQSGYRLVVLGENDEPARELGTFEADGLLSVIDVKIDQTGPVRLAIMTDEDDPRTLFVAEVKLA